MKVGQAVKHIPPNGRDEQMKIPDISDFSKEQQKIVYQLCAKGLAKWMESEKKGA